MADKSIQKNKEFDEAHEALLTVLDSIDATIYVASMKTHEILYMNKYMKDHFGYEEEGKICFKSFRQIDEPCPHCTNNILLDKDGLSTGVHVWEAENPLTKRWYRNYDRAIRWIDGTWARLQIATDVTNSKEIERSLHQLHDDLEKRVKDRTEALNKSNIELKIEIEEHNKVKKALIESENLLKKAQEISKTGNFRYDFDTGELHWSDQYYRLLGLEPGNPERPDHEIFLSRIHPEDRDRVNDLLTTEDGFKTANYNFEFKTIPINQEVRSILVHSEMEFDDTGKPISMVGINRDVTEQREAQGKLKKSESMYRRLVNNISEGLIITDREFNIKFVNPRFSEITGYEKDDIINLSAKLLFQKSDQTEIKKFYLQCLKGQSSSFEIQIARLDKIKLPVIISGNPMMEDGVFTGVFIVMTNILNIREAQQEVVEHIRNLNRAQKISHTGSWFWDVETGVSEWSDEMLRILGYDPQTDIQVTEDVFFNRIHPADREKVKKVTNQGIKKGEGFNYEYRTVPLNGSIKTIRCYVEVDKDENGKPIRLIGIDQDITKDRLKEKALRIAKAQAEASNEAKTNFLANMSHELRTPMQGIIGFSKLCLAKIMNLKREKIEEYLNDIYQSAIRMMNLVNDLLDLSKLETGENQYHYRKENLDHLIHDRIMQQQMTAQEKNLTFSFESDESGNRVEIDKKKIGQVIDNLLSNAIRYAEPESQIGIGVSEQNDFIQFSINNKGIDIPVKEMESIFDKFSQSSNTKTGAGGTGLGLAICKQIIFDHNGEIWAENNENGSVTFFFQIPARQS